MIKKAFCFLMAFGLCLSIWSQTNTTTVIFQESSIFGAPQQRNITLALRSSVQGIAGAFVWGPYTLTPNSSGFLSTNLVPGTYSVQFDGVSKPYYMPVPPASTNVYNALDLINAGLSMDQPIPALAAGNNTTLVTSYVAGQKLVTINAGANTNGGGSFNTNAPLVMAGGAGFDTSSNVYGNLVGNAASATVAATAIQAGSATNAATATNAQNSVLWNGLPTNALLNVATPIANRLTVLDTRSNLNFTSLLWNPASGIVSMLGPDGLTPQVQVGTNGNITANGTVAASGFIGLPIGTYSTNGIITTNDLASVRVIPAYNGMVTKPMLGFETWVLTQGDANGTFSQQGLLGVMTNMIQQGYVAAGYTSFLIDEGWGTNRDVNGNILSSTLFPNGIPWLISNLHSNGMKAGLFFTLGQNGYAGQAGSANYLIQDATNAANWGVDFVFIVVDDNAPGYSPVNGYCVNYWRYKTFISALQSTGRKILVYGTTHAWEPWIQTGLDAAFYAGYPGYADYDGTWATFLNMVNGFPSQANMVQPGHYLMYGWLSAGLDGSGNNSTNATAALMGMLALYHSPLFTANTYQLGLTSFYTNVANIQLNSQMLRIDQDSLANPPQLVASNNLVETWYEPLSGGQFAIGVLNTDTSGTLHTVAFSWTNIATFSASSPIPAGSYVVQDVWNGTNFLDTTNGIGYVLSSNTMALFLLTPTNPAASLTLSGNLSVGGTSTLTGSVGGSGFSNSVAAIVTNIALEPLTIPTNSVAGPFVGVSGPGGNAFALSYNGGALTNLNAAQIASGTVPLANLPASILTNNNAGAVSLLGSNYFGGPSSNAGPFAIAGSLSASNGLYVTGPINGSGANLTGLNGSQITSGTVPLANLPANIFTNGMPAIAIHNGNLMISNAGVNITISSNWVAINNAGSGITNYIATGGNSSAFGSVFYTGSPYSTTENTVLTIGTNHVDTLGSLATSNVIVFNINTPSISVAQAIHSTSVSSALYQGATANANFTMGTAAQVLQANLAGTNSFKGMIAATNGVATMMTNWSYFTGSYTNLNTYDVVVQITNNCPAQYWALQYLGTNAVGPVFNTQSNQQFVLHYLWALTNSGGGFWFAK